MLFLSKIKTLVFFLVVCAAINSYGNDRVKIVTTLPDLEAIADEIGGDKVETSAIARGYQDPHFVDAKPSFVLKLKQADLFIQIGLDLEIGWVPPLLETSRNKSVYFGGNGYVNASAGVELLEVPNIDAAQLRAQGDIHIYGNPHYWLDPRNGKIIARNIMQKLIEIRPEFAQEFRDNYQRFAERIDQAYEGWRDKMAEYKGTKIIAYHNSWPYFEQAFGFDIVDFIEPKPGIPPSPSHLVSVIRLMREENIKIIIISPYFDDKPARSVASRTGAEVVHIAASVGAFEGIDTYSDLFEYNLNALTEAIAKVK